jgi:hypothetical protein
MWALDSLELHATGGCVETRRVSAELLLCGAILGGLNRNGLDVMPRHAVLGTWDDFGKEHKSGVGTEKWIQVFLRTEADLHCSI